MNRRKFNKATTVVDIASVISPQDVLAWADECEIDVDGPIGGTFTISHRGQTTDALSAFASDAEIQSALRTLYSNPNV